MTPNSRLQILFFCKILWWSKLHFNGLVRPCLEYAVSVWCPKYCLDDDRIEKVLRRATKMVTEIRHLLYEERLRELNMPSLHHRRKRGDLIQVYKIVHGIDNIEPEMLLQKQSSNYNLRGYNEAVWHFIGVYLEIELWIIGMH